MAFSLSYIHRLLLRPITLTCIHVIHVMHKDKTLFGQNAAFAGTKSEVLFTDTVFEH